MLGDIISYSTVQASCQPWNYRTCVGAYRIRPSRQRDCTSFNHHITHEMTEKWYGAREYGNNVGVKTHRSVIMSPVKWSNRCRGVSHTPWCGRKWNNVAQHDTIVWFAFSPTWRAYAIRPYSFCLKTWTTKPPNKPFWCQHETHNTLKRTTTNL